MVDVGPTDPRTAARLDEERREAARRRRELALSALEVAFLLAAVVGVGLWSVPLALVVGGTVGVVACEWSARRRAPQPPTAPRSGPRPGGAKE